MEMVCGGLRLAYDLAGSGAPVTLIHGLTAARGVWHSQVEALKPSHRVLAYDLRGHGESAKPAKPAYTYEDHVDDLRGLMDGLGIKRTALAGWSMGASIAVAFAAAHPERVSRLVLIDGTPSLVALPDFPHGITPEQQAALIEIAERDFPSLLRTTGQTIFPGRRDPEMEERLRAMAHQAGPEPYIGAMRQTAPVDLRPVIKRVSAPALVLHGEWDILCPVPAGRFFAENIDGAVFQLIAGAGHGPHLTHPDEVNAEMKQFLAV
jgi:pimeloyl-ACP methyl ester carboxylesterase